MKTRDDELHWAVQVRGYDAPLHAGTESAFDEGYPCELPEPGWEMGLDQCDACGSFDDDGEPTSYTVDASQKGVICNGCGEFYPFFRAGEDDIVW